MKNSFFLSKKFFRILLMFLVLGFCFGCQKDLLQTENSNDPETTGLKSAKISNYMVIANSETLPVGFENQVASYGKIVRSIPEIGVVVVKPSVANFEKKVAQLSGVKAVVPDLVTKWIEPEDFTPTANPISIGSNETYFSYQWGMDAINAPEAWNEGFTGQGARVFILDSGIDAEHPDLAPNLNTTLSTSFISGEDYNIQPGLYFNHGTHVAGIIAAADNSRGVIGVAPYAEIVAVKVLSEYTGSGPFSGINAGIVYAANNGADVINMSLGATLNKNGFYFDENNVLQKVPAVVIQNIIIAMQRAVNYAFKNGVTIVAAAGNDGTNADGDASLIKLPGGLVNVIAVSATAPFEFAYNYGSPNLNFDIPASYTNYGKSLVDLAAPGGDFLSEKGLWYYDMVFSTISNGYSWAAGTSMAAPYVAGVAALIIAKNGGQMDPSEVLKQLLKTADKIDGNGTSAYYGKGRVNAFRAVTE